MGKGSAASDEEGFPFKEYARRGVLSFVKSCNLLHFFCKLQPQVWMKWWFQPGAWDDTRSRNRCVSRV